MSTTVRDNPDENRFEVLVDDQVAGFAEYRLAPGRISFTHTEVGPDYSGRGLAGELVRTALDEVKGRGLDVLPFCPFVRKYIDTHQDDYLALVPADQRDKFGLPAAE
ncbi:GNAT family N-acetyltransferase [Barrientosiimonas endolithica]|uniref:Acetyltransferase n=1 Tax=Barrientosiimonas endolithica TaxID=1535208 RepID=A0ABN6YXX0_9MICO|nr:GNAT family N-acetyltransferase [Barrientosiimonas endolithica]BDZ59828.1 hypothetical protein GCM10025872_34850 [Barrientosiimonas endolithica]